jgi:RHS repeat-associated protein
MALLQGVAHTHDLEGNKTSTTRLHDLSKSEAYGLDVVYRLTNFKLGSLVGQSIPTPAQEVSFNLDPVGNWNSVVTDGITQNRSHNEVNEITAVNSTSLAHDDNGNLTDDGQHLLNWDEENRLLEVRRKSDHALLVQNEFDALSRRVVKKSFVPALQETQFFYHQTGFLPLVETDSAGNIQKSYVWGRDLAGSKDVAGGIGGLVSVTNHSTGRTLFPLFDTMGNVTGLTDASGVLTASFRYAAYGELLEAVGVDAQECSLLFSTKYLDSEVGLYYFGFRFYHHQLGRWCSRDPIQKDLYWYEAFYDNPYRFLDALGEQNWDAISEGAWNLALEPIRAIHDIGRGTVALVRGEDLSNVTFYSMSSNATKAEIIRQLGEVSFNTTFIPTLNLGATALTGGTWMLGLQLWDILNAHERGEISVEEVEYYLSNLAGAQMFAAALGNAALGKSTTRYEIMLRQADSQGKSNPCPPQRFSDRTGGNTNFMSDDTPVPNNKPIYANELNVVGSTQPELFMGTVREMAQQMRSGIFDWQKALERGAIEIWEINGKRYLYDGNHRFHAALEAGVPIPANHIIIVSNKISEIPTFTLQNLDRLSGKK